MPINMNGSHLSSNRTFEFQKMNQFELIIGDLAQEVTLSVSKAFLPEVSLDVVEVPYFNGKTKFAGLANFEGGSIEVRDAIGADIEKILYNWFKSTYDWTTGSMGYATDYKKEITVIEYSGDGQVSRTWKLKGCWISTFAGGELDYSSGDLKVITLTIQYDSAERV